MLDATASIGLKNIIIYLTLSSLVVEGLLGPAGLGLLAITNLSI